MHDLPCSSGGRHLEASIWRSNLSGPEPGNRRRLARRPRAWFAATHSGGLGSSSAPTTGGCLEWLDGAGRRRRKPLDRAGEESAVRVPEARSRGQKSRGGAPGGVRPHAEGAPRLPRRGIVKAPSRRSAPLIFGEQKRDDGPPAPPTTGPAERWLFENQIRKNRIGGVSAERGRVGNARKYSSQPICKNGLRAFKLSPEAFCKGGLL
jgi:hypothetical protein